jgi:hypothetical protein
MKNKYLINGELTTIYVLCRNGDKFEVYIDTEDIPRLDGLTVGVNSKKLYATITLGCNQVLLHRYINNTPIDLQTDHIDGNKFNNSKSNLRSCTNFQNSHNRIKLPTHNTSGIVGVGWKASKNKWQATCMYNGKSKFIGYFNCIDDATKALEDFRKENSVF